MAYKIVWMDQMKLIVHQQHQIQQMKWKQQKIRSWNVNIQIIFVIIKQNVFLFIHCVTINRIVKTNPMKANIKIYVNTTGLQTFKTITSLLFSNCLFLNNSTIFLILTTSNYQSENIPGPQKRINLTFQSI